MLLLTWLLLGTRYKLGHWGGAALAVLGSILLVRAAILAYLQSLMPLSPTVGQDCVVGHALQAGPLAVPRWPCWALC